VNGHDETKEQRSRLSIPLHLATETASVPKRSYEERFCCAEVDNGWITVIHSIVEHFTHLVNQENLAYGAYQACENAQRQLEQGLAVV
jgi:hypothetical protein